MKRRSFQRPTIPQLRPGTRFSTGTRVKTGLHLALGLALTSALVACGSAKDAPNPNGAPTADSLSSSAMSQVVLETFAQTASPELLSTLARYASGTGFDTVGGPPLLGFLGGGVGGLSLAQTRAIQAKAVQIRADQIRAEQFRARQAGGLNPQAIRVGGSDCTTLPGDQTDTDSDGILDASLATYSCSGDVGFAYSYDGEWSMRDKVQGDSGAAYLFTGNSLGRYSLQEGGLTYAWTYAEKSSLDTVALAPGVAAPGVSAAGGSTANYLYNWDARGSAGILGIAATFDLKWRLNLRLERTPDASSQGSAVSQGSTVRLSGRASAGNTQTGLGGYSDLVGTLHYSRACGGFDSGSLRFGSGGSSKTVTYTGCGVSQ